MSLLLQGIWSASASVIEEGKAMLIIGGELENNSVYLGTQIVRPGHPTVQGPAMQEWAKQHCSTSLGDDRILVTGGKRMTQPYSSDQVEILNTKTGVWTQVSRLQQQRAQHSCTSVWLSPDDTNILRGVAGNSSVLTGVVAGGIF